eukprot:10623005-Alexandrium_andersonii.AAC.1
MSVVKQAAAMSFMPFLVKSKATQRMKALRSSPTNAGKLPSDMSATRPAATGGITPFSACCIASWASTT